MAQLTFDSTGIERPGNYEPVPNGEYPMIVHSSSMKHKKGFGGEPDKSTPPYLELKISIIDGEYKNRELTERLNINHIDPNTRKIANGKFASFLDAIGLVSIMDSSETHNRPFIGRVAVKPGEGNYGPSNEIKQYKPFCSTVTAPANSAAPAAAKKPWE